MDKPNTLQQAIRYFKDEQTCIDTVAKLRWPDGPVCPKCGHKQHYYLATQKRWKCKKCGKQFSVKAGTVFEDSPIGLDKWLVALWMLVNCRNGVSSYEVARALGITQKSAWFMLHRLRLAMQVSGGEPFGGSGQIVEADESFVGGKVANMHKDRQNKMRKMRSDFIGNGQTLNKAAVMGILDRKLRKVRATVVKQINRETMREEILPYIAKGSKIVTDEATIYRAIPKDYDHDFVNHMHTYVRGDVHTNGLENYWSLLKRGVKGTYISVEPFHLFRYIDEQTFRYNNRIDEKGVKRPDGERFDIALSQIAGKRLTFAEVTGKVGETVN
ncbi:MAG: IS1595 family transposase [Candidatus Acidiferrales bacterium]